MTVRVEQMHTGGILATVFWVAVSSLLGLVGGSLESVRRLLAGMTQAEATLAVGLVAAVLSQAGVWMRWWFERRWKVRR